MGRPGWVRSSAWIWLFSSIDSTTAWAGGSTYRPTTSLNFGELRVVGELERLHPVRRQAIGLPDALHADGADAGRFGHRANAPVRGFVWRVGQRQVDHVLDGRGGQRRLAGLARLVAQQAIDAFLHE